MIYENRPHRRHFTVYCLQWSITFLTEYITDELILSIYVLYTRKKTVVFLVFFSYVPIINLFNGQITKEQKEQLYFAHDTRIDRLGSPVKFH